MAVITQRTVRTPDGRTLAVEEAGDPGAAAAGHLTLETQRIGEVHAWLADRI